MLYFNVFIKGPQVGHSPMSGFIRFRRGVLSGQDHNSPGPGAPPLVTAVASSDEERRSALVSFLVIKYAEQNNLREKGFIFSSQFKAQLSL